MKKILSLFVLLFSVCVLANTVFASPYSHKETSIPIVINAKQQHYDQSPILLDNRILVPFRGIFESLGGTVGYDSVHKKVTAQKGNQIVELTIDSTFATVNDQMYTLDVPATAINGRTLVPLRFVSESLGADVHWDVNTNIVYITYSEDRAEQNNPDTPANNEKDIDEVIVPVPEKETYNPDEYHPDVLPEELTEKEKELAILINEYRESLGLQPLKVSKSLTTVARYHVWDSNTYNPSDETDSNGKDCNLHSWSNNGEWDGMCYTSDHAYKELMWSKPRELTNYKGYGFEISVGFGRIGDAESPKRALELWKDSPGHNDVIVGNGRTWAQLEVMGIGIDGTYAHVWFGTNSDPEGYYDLESVPTENKKNKE